MQRNLRERFHKFFCYIFVIKVKSIISLKSTMSNFDHNINEVKSDLDQRLKEFKCEKKNSDWSLKMDIEAKLDKFECSTETTNNKVIPKFITRGRGSKNLNFQVHPYGVAFFESLEHAKISYTNIEFQNRFEQIFLSFFDKNF